MRDQIGSPAPPTIPRDQMWSERIIHNRAEFLNRKALSAASVLRSRNLASLGVYLDTNQSGIKILHYLPPILGDSTEEEARISGRIDSVIESYKIKNEAAANMARNTPGVLHAEVIQGAVVIIHDTSKHPANDVLGRYSQTVLGPIGEYHDRTAQQLGAIFVDLNPNKYPEGITPSVVLQHELGHHNLALTRYALAQENDLGMQSVDLKRWTQMRPNARYDYTPATEGYLFSDRLQYYPILGRPFEMTDTRNILYQQAYLNEVHSYFLTGDLNYFNLKNNGAYNGFSSGYHSELVGLNQYDIAVGQRLLGFIQAAIFLNRHFSSYDDLISKSLVSKWRNAYSTITGILGTSLTLNQAEILVEREWAKFVDENLSALAQESSRIYPQLIWHDGNNFGIAPEVWNLLYFQRKT